MTNLERMLELKRQGLKNKQIASELGVTKNTVIGALWRHEQAQAVDTPKNVLSFPSLPKPVIVQRPENQETDLARWESERDTLLKNHDFVRVMHMNDVHLPYHDDIALRLWFQVAARFQPHIVVVGSDMLDLPTISNFERDPDIDVGDWHYQARQYYWPVIETLDHLLPKSIFVWIYGNHEMRALKKIKEESSPILGMDNWRQTVRCKERVLHVGRTKNVKIGGLVVAHGDKTGRTAAERMGGLWPTKYVNFGHIHKHLVSENDRAFSNGKLCLPPHYNDDGNPINETLGTGTMTLDTLPFGGVSWTHHNFVETEGGLWTTFGDSLISVDKQEMADSAAA
jgi:hypothetical protein